MRGLTPDAAGRRLAIFVRRPMSRWPIVSLTIAAAFVPWVVGDALFVHSGESEKHWASSSHFLQGSFFWAVLVLAIATAWLAFARLIRFGSALALAGSIVAFLAGGAIFGYLTFVAAIFVHTRLFGGSI